MSRQNVMSLSREELDLQLREAEAEYRKFLDANLKLDMSRGKPGRDVLDLNLPLLDKLDAPWSDGDIADVRNYGGLDGISGMRKLFGELLGIDPESILIGGNSSLNLMYDAIMRLWVFGAPGFEPWSRQGHVRFLCPAPGYDRHFAVTAEFGIELVTVPMTPEGPDMDMVEELAANDPLVKGIWVVPVYSNPQGICCSQKTVDRLGRMKCAAPDFRIFWDNAYGVHRLYDDEPEHFPDIFAACEKGGNPDRVLYFFSTSKITFPGGGVSMVAASPANRAEIRRRMSIQIISHDKINQLRTLRYLRDPAGVREQMRRIAEVLRPKFETVLGILDEELGGTGLASWSSPRGGYFVALDTLDGGAKETVRLAKEAGVTLTGAGATFPYGRDPRDRNIRIAPSFPKVSELEMAMKLLCVCIRVSGLRKLLAR